MGSPRLSTQTLDAVHPNVMRPAYDVENTAVGHVHIGVGAFMRAFVAIHNDDALTATGGNWGIAGVSLRQKTVADQLAPQDCLFTLATLDNDIANYRLIGSIRSIELAPDNPQRIVELLAAATVHVVTITVTEKGYGLNPDSGELDRSNPDIAHDLRDLHAPRSLLGFLVAGLKLRRERGGAPLTVISCDNLPDNGTRLRNGVLDFAEAVDTTLRAWIEAHVSFPATMVDRITPATTADDLDTAESVLGVRDEALVKTEPFSQWVIEDNFRSDRPNWEAGGALLVDDVRSYEAAKLQLLNGPHSALAYLGYLAGHEFVSDVMQQPEFATYIRLLMTREISPATAEPAGMEHEQYIEALLRRFENTALRHRTWQIAMDGSQKLPQRLLNTLRAQLKRGGPIAGLSLAVAAWMRYVLGRDEAGQLIDVRDPLLEDFVRIRSQTTDDADELVAQFAGLQKIFGTDLANDRRFTSTLAAQYRLLLENGAAGAVQDYVKSNDGLS